MQSFLNNNITTKKLNFSRRLRREKKETDAEFSFQLLDTKNDIVGKHVYLYLQKKNYVKYLMNI